MAFTEITFESPPSRSDKQKGRSVVIDEMLRSKPGEWARIEEFPLSKNVGGGAFYAWLSYNNMDKGEYEFAYRTDDVKGVKLIYARYVGKK